MSDMYWHPLGVACPDCGISNIGSCVSVNQMGGLRVEAICQHCHQRVHWETRLAEMMAECRELDRELDEVIPRLTETDDGETVQ